MELSTLSNRLNGQPMFQILDKANKLEAQGKEIFHLEIGDTSYPTHSLIIEATQKALHERKTQYVSSSGIEALKQEIINYTFETAGFKPKNEQILIMPANASIDAIIRCTLNNQDNCLIPDPGFSTYESTLNYLNQPFKRYNIINTNNHFKIDLNHLKKQITESTKLIILNSPSNPTGMIIPQDELKEIYSFAQDNNLYILSDEVYSEILYSNKTHQSISSNDYCKQHSIIINSFSKNFQMSGYRLGYVIAPKELIQKLTLLYETVYSCTPEFIQWGGVAALQRKEIILKDILKKYHRTRDLVYETFNSIEGVHCNEIEGAIYAFIDISGLGITGDEFAAQILQEEGVALLPGSYFSTQYINFFRINFARDYNYMEQALQKIRQFITRNFS